MEGVIGKKSRWVLDGKRGKFYLRMQLFPSGWKKNTPLNKSPHFCFVFDCHTRMVADKSYDSARCSRGTCKINMIDPNARRSRVSCSSMIKHVNEYRISILIFFLIGLLN